MPRTTYRFSFDNTVNEVIAHEIIIEELKEKGYRETFRSKNALGVVVIVKYQPKCPDDERIELWNIILN